MNKKQLLDELNKKFHKVSTITNAEQNPDGQAIRLKEGINCYIAGVYERQGDVLLRRNIGFYVENENKRDERAFYAERMPTNTLSQQPIKSRFGDVDGVIEQEAKDFAVVKRFVVTNNIAEEKRFLVKKVGGKLTEYPIKEQVINNMSIGVR